MTGELVEPLPAHDERALTLAVAELEHPSFIARVAHYAGTPVDAAIKYLPDAVSRRLRDVIKTAMFKCLEVAIESLEEDEELPPPSPWMGKVMTGFTGGVGGFFGMAALPFELPLTTTLMLRSIAEIARDEGEDVKSPETMLACLEVFALGGGRESRQEIALEYYSVRTVLSQITRDVGRSLMERGALHASTPLMARLIGEIVTRFGFAVTDRFASSAIPVIGAVGGATVNMIFMDHFQRVARGHFTVRRLERRHGAEIVRGHYRRAALELNGGHA
ncbi:MAG TPA: EcsC family protein [Stellaceae bacterium]|nr:EcsC family protein [Stellaceae bacterium]